ncbi:MAG: alkaline phosphatase family protein [Acidimicrobiia bacterium]|nr:alkaline phosphatase family protein [Acidimicrobiia bacterium]
MSAIEPGSFLVSHRFLSLWRSWKVILLTLALDTLCLGSTQRVVIVKADGLPFDLLDRWVQEIDPRSGKSLLPWIKSVFYDGGSRVSNFYVRGLSLSAPSWALLDSGRPSLIRGNMEFDRLTHRSYDYLNFFTFYLKQSVGRRIEMPGVEVLDEQKTPLLADAYPSHERHMSFQLYQRGNSNLSATRSLKHFLTRRNPKEMLDEWTLGFEGGTVLFELMERELIVKLSDPQVRYLDFMTPVFDHVAHLNRDRETQLRALKQIDALVGRLWTAIEQSPMAAETALILVSDHGMNTNEQIYSQGYNLVSFFGSAAGGGHHVVTNRPPRGDYTFKALSPTVPLITTPAQESYYLHGETTRYPTLLLDPDGNERASVYLRHSDLNLLHILLLELWRQDLTPATRRAAAQALFSTLDRNRRAWGVLLSELSEELAALRRSIEKHALPARSQRNKSIAQEKRLDKGQKARLSLQLSMSQADVREYSAYSRVLANLLSLRPESFDPSRWKIHELIPPKSMGEINSVYNLQNYVVGLASRGLMLDSHGSLDTQKSYVRIDYFQVLKDLRTRNNVQPGVSSAPVDFTAVAVTPEALALALPANCLPVEDAVWLYGGRDRQALILARHDKERLLFLRYLPVQHLTQNSSGSISFSPQEWLDELPLRIWEDSKFEVPEDQRAAWLDAWHTEEEWLRALHGTQYSNGLISLYEQFAQSTETWHEIRRQQASPEERLLLRFQERKRRLAQVDLIVFANDHWNFNIRGFNPGGNHGSFFRASTHSTLMFAGGSGTGIPRGLLIEEPYDSLSFAPTVLWLAGKLTDEGLGSELRNQNFQPFPGRVIRQIVTERSPAFSGSTTGQE